MPAFIRGVRLHRRHEILRAHPGQARYSRLSADAAFPVASGASDCLAAGPDRVGLDSVGEILRILTGEARPPRRRDADAKIAVTAGAQPGRGPAGRCIAAYRRSFRPIGDLPGIISGDVLYLGFA